MIISNHLFLWYDIFKIDDRIIATWTGDYKKRRPNVGKIIFKYFLGGIYGRRIFI
jgi:hypothetical protein